MRVLHPDGIHRDLVLRADTASDLELIVRDTSRLTEPQQQTLGRKPTLTLSLATPTR